MRHTVQPLGARCLWILVSCLLLLGCGDGDDKGRSLFDDDDRFTTLIIDGETAGHETAVRLDSVSWYPTTVLPAPGHTLEIVGDFAIAFHNDSDVILYLSDDLRFFDDDDFLVDNFIPFSLPLRLEPGAITWQRGEFVLRGGPDAARYGLRTLRIVITRLDTLATSSGG